MINEPNNNFDPAEEFEQGFTVIEPQEEEVLEVASTAPKHSHKKEKGRREKKQRTTGQKVRRVLLIILCVLLAMLLIAATTVFVMYKIGERKMMNYNVSVKAPQLPMVEYSNENGDTVQYNGATYNYNKNSVNILLIGLDKKEYDHDIGYGKNGQGDVLIVVNIDVKTGIINVLPVSRDTIAEIMVFNKNGKYVETRNDHICLAYAYGKDRDDGCQNIRSSVRSLLYNIPIEHYISIDMMGLEKLTNAVGGVEVTPIESISNQYGSVTKGKKVTLKGDLVNLYVRSRDGDLYANDRRMERQKQFLTAFVSHTSSMLKKDMTRLPGFYNTAKPYTASNLSLDEVTYLVSRYLANGGSKLNFHSIAGEKTIDSDNHAVFTPDETSLWEAVLATCYQKVE
ncbi:MAG: LCP family protein [Clostridia bacterium]|nr:LCP family protein [Clostridia bacterium]